MPYDEYKPQGMEYINGLQLLGIRKRLARKIKEFDEDTKPEEMSNIVKARNKIENTLICMRIALREEDMELFKRAGVV